MALKSSKQPLKMPRNIAEVNLLIELSEQDKKYSDIKNELVTEIAKLELEMAELNEKIATLNKMAAVLINLDNTDSESRRLACYDYAWYNMTQGTTQEKLNSEMKKLQNEFIKYMNSYKLEVKNLEEFIKILNKSSSSKEF